MPPDVTLDDSIRVLLVEDDEPHSTVLRGALAAAKPPIEVEHCRTLRDAIAHLAAGDQQRGIVQPEPGTILPPRDVDDREIPGQSPAGRNESMRGVFVSQ